ncbi:MAG: DNA repair protein RecN [Flavobacteriales bacterium]|nr:DNA repair protein RecN [Flavobacteriales bacterium]|tara:strand:- start:22385 stop:24022 length:1638 start_codon:yes stop_codon:yes gene_type:complete
MIISLKIKNYTLLKDVFIEFKKGLTVISGETGSGKSIILDALGLVLGKRVERFSIDKTTSQSIIEAVFSVEETKSNFFNKYDIDFQELTVVRRELNPSGKSKAYINGTPVLVNVLSEFGNKVVEMHYQNQSILLKDEFSQFDLIDKLARSEKLLLNYQKCLQKYNKLNEELSLLRESSSLSESELDFLQFQLSELNSSNLMKGEKERLEDQIAILENVEGISNVISESDNFLNSERGVLFQLADIKRRLLEFETFSELHKRIDSVIIELNDVSSDLTMLENNLGSNSDKLYELNNRLDLINKLLYKHNKNSVEDLLNYQKEIEKKIHLSESSEADIKTKNNQIKEQFAILKINSDKLNNKRDKIVPVIQKEIESYLANLGMPYARFLPVFNEVNNYHRFGNTSISFLFSANKGSSLLDISKVASGGELSRLMLVIKYILAKSYKLDTLVFDEIDLGVSGEIASLMGDMMKEISKSTQLIAISHLPQIASKADFHIKVVKKVVGNKTISDVVVLDDLGRLKEIAKLLSGKKVTSAAFENARDLLKQ